MESFRDGSCLEPATRRSLMRREPDTNFTWTRDGRLIDDKDNTLQWVNPESGAKGLYRHSSRIPQRRSLGML